MFMSSQIVNPEGMSRQNFYEQVKSKFSNNFWLTFRISDIKLEATRKTVLNTHHPLISKFLNGKIINHYLSNPGSEEYKYFSKVRRLDLNACQ